MSAITPTPAMKQFLLRNIPDLTEAEIEALPEWFAIAFAENAGSFGELTLAAKLWKRLMNAQGGS